MRIKYWFWKIIAPALIMAEITREAYSYMMLKVIAVSVTALVINTTQILDSAMRYFNFAYVDASFLFGTIILLVFPVFWLFGKYADSLDKKVKKK